MLCLSFQCSNKVLFAAGYVCTVSAAGIFCAFPFLLCYFVGGHVQVIQLEALLFVVSLLNQLIDLHCALFSPFFF